jgi:integral membrane sensor domain MASE1
MGLRRGIGFMLLSGALIPVALISFIGMYLDGLYSLWPLAAFVNSTGAILVGEIGIDEIQEYWRKKREQEKRAQR